MNRLFQRGRILKVALLAIAAVGVTIYFGDSIVAWAAEGGAENVAAAAKSQMPWWMWPLLLFIVSYMIGFVAVLGGVGGGVLFVPIVSGFFPFHLDFVRGTGLIVALSTALAAGPSMLKKNLASIRLALPFGLIASTSAIGGAMIGLALPANLIQLFLGITILFIVGIMFMAKKSELPHVPAADKWSTALKITGIYHEASSGKDIDWKIHRTPMGFVLFAFIGVLAGMFGLGAGWANVPVLNLVLGVPLKVSVATSVFLLSITDTSAAWVYINKGAVPPIMVVPAILGTMLGSMTGVRLLAKIKPSAVRYIVITMLLLAGLRAFLKGLGI